MNGHPRDQAKVSVHCRWPLIRGNLTLKCVGRGIDNVAVQGRWPLTAGVALKAGTTVLWSIVSNAFFKSIKTPTVDIELSIAVVISSTSSNIAIDVECFFYETHIDPRKVFVYHSRMALIYYGIFFRVFLKTAVVYL